MTQEASLFKRAWEFKTDYLRWQKSHGKGGYAKTASIQRTLRTTLKRSIVLCFASETCLKPSVPNICLAGRMRFDTQPTAYFRIRPAFLGMAFRGLGVLRKNTTNYSSPDKALYSTLKPCTILAIKSLMNLLKPKPYTLHLKPYTALKLVRVLLKQLNPRPHASVESRFKALKPQNLNIFRVPLLKEEAPNP